RHTRSKRDWSSDVCSSDLFFALARNGACHRHKSLAAPAVEKALATGVQGFLPKTASAEEFAAAVRTVHGGGRYIDPELAAMTIKIGRASCREREQRTGGGG